MIKKNPIPKGKLPILWLESDQMLLPGLTMTYMPELSAEYKVIKKVLDRDGYVVLAYNTSPDFAGINPIANKEDLLGISDLPDIFKTVLGRISDYYHDDDKIVVHIQGIMPVDYYDLEISIAKGGSIDYTKIREYQYNEIRNQKEFEKYKNELIQLETSIRKSIDEEITDINLLSKGDDEYSILMYLLKVLRLNYEDAVEFLFNRDIENSILRLYHQRLDELAWFETKQKYEQKIAKKRDYTNKLEILKELIQDYQEELKINSIFKGSNPQGKGQKYENEIFETFSNPVIGEYIKKFSKLKLSESVRQVISKEYEKINYMSPQNPEYTTTLEYLDTLSNLPWGKIKAGNTNIESAKMILDDSNYGLDDVKERIIEEIAVKIKRGNDNNDSILCLIGPPGVGKTSIAQSVATALNREFVRMSLGGVQNEAEIRGHRRTYVGSRPGRIITNLIKCKSNNPIFLLDEIDKMSHNSAQGDPAAALLEVLDPMVNKTFRDNYLEVDYDLSNIFFIATANDVNAIPRVLLDRMEVINLGGYTENEKVKIANEYIIPKQIRKTGMSGCKIVFEDDALRTIINEYTSEAGVRILEQKIVKIIRKIAVSELKSSDKSVNDAKSKEYIITKNKVYEMLGNDRYVSLSEIKEDSVAMINGLAWTQNGGEIIVIEADFVPGKGEIILTGQLGDVMKESAKIAQSYVLSKLIKDGADLTKYEKYNLHINLPEGAIPKDGPSAGITLATVIYSLYTDKKIKASFAMTGEITLKGNVLPIGGLKEKILAAIRHNIKNIIVPKANEKDYLNLSDEIKEKINIHFVSRIEEVYQLVLI